MNRLTFALIALLAPAGCSQTAPPAPARVVPSEPAPAPILDATAAAEPVAAPPDAAAGEPGRDVSRAPGKLSIKVNVESGIVFVDGEAKAKVANGVAHVREVSPGSHRVTIEADGYRRHESTVTVAGGKATSLEVTMTPQR